MNNNIPFIKKMDFNALSRFLSDPEIRPAGFTFSTVNAQHTTFFDQFTGSEMQSYRDKLAEKRDEYKRKLMAGEKVDDIERRLG